MKGVLVGLLPCGGAQLGDQQVAGQGAWDVRVVLEGTGESAQGVGELHGQAGVLVQEGLGKGERLLRGGVLAQVVGEEGEGLPRRGWCQG